MDGATSVTPPPDGMTDADIARRPTEVLLEVLRREGFAEPNPRPIFPNSPGLLRVEPYSEGLRDRIWWGAGSNATAGCAAKLGTPLAEVGRNRRNVRSDLKNRPMREIAALQLGQMRTFGLRVVDCVQGNRKLTTPRTIFRSQTGARPVASTSKPADPEIGGNLWFNKSLNLRT